MSDFTPASENAFSRLGRSWDSQRGDVVVSGRMTPTSALPLPPLLPPLLLPPPLSLPPQAARAPNASTPVATRDAYRAPLFLTISSTSMAWHRDVTTITGYVVSHNILTPRPPRQALRMACFVARSN